MNNEQIIALLEQAMTKVKNGEVDAVGLILAKGDGVSVHTAGGGSSAALHLGAGQMQSHIQDSVFNRDPAIVRAGSFDRRFS